MFSLLFGDSSKELVKKDDLKYDLVERIEELTSENADKDEIISQMTQGLIVVDGKGVVQRINPAACSMLAIQSQGLSGKLLEEVVHIHELQNFIRECLKKNESSHKEVLFDASDGERLLQVYGKIFNNSQNSASILIAINDISHIRRLENLRREFVANVSHELKTPITAIQGFVETLREGAIDDPSHNQRFLGIISKHAERLHNIIENLLSLSRIEQDKEEGEIQLDINFIYKSLTTALQACEKTALDKGVILNLNCPERLQGYFNAGLLEQAVINLVKNAVEYSTEGSSVLVEVINQDERVTIRVIDKGCGIEAIHLPRIFERFYRVDKSRSRKDGGSGLGLSIVKHIAQAHGGFAGVESLVGKGSTFYITIKGVRDER